MADDRFRLHPGARLTGPDGAGQRADVAAMSLPDPDEGPLALAQAMAAAGQGLPFRLGGEGPAPAPGELPVFETLTSGSTGRARRIRRSQASWTASFAVNGAAFGIGPGRQVAVLGALVHSLALYGAVEGLHLGAGVHLLGGLRPDRQAGALAARGVDTVYATPAQLAALPGAPLPALRRVLVGGARLTAPLRARLAAMAPGAVLHEFYGAAETSFITLADAATPPGSAGRAYPGASIALRGGEVWVRSPYLFEGYASDPGAARREGDWMTVGEMGRIEDGFLFIDGRRDRMVTVADQNVFPEAVEAAMEALPGITRAAVLARPDPARGHVLHAVAMGDPGAEAAVLAALRAEFGPMKAPRRILWRDDWPVLPSGKTDLRALEAGG